jgi:RHS repeat-associated protein
MFTGREYDTETANYYYRARYYSPKIGRFLQTDPIGYEGGLNLYTYVRNNPIRWRDPFGFDIWVESDPKAWLGLHKRICVGHPYGNFKAYSFAMEGSLWNAFNPFKMGFIYEDDDAYIRGHRGRISRSLQTTSQEDQRAQDVLQRMEGERMRYGVIDNNCSNFSDDMFNILEEDIKEGRGEKECPPQSTGPTLPADPVDVTM